MPMHTDHGGFFSWVPFGPGGLEESAEISVRATLDAAGQLGGTPRVVATGRSALDDPGVLAAFAARYPSGTPRGRWPEAGGPVLAWMPDVELLHRAVRLAAGTSLVVTEWPDGDIPWAAWAAQVAAVDLRTGKTTPDPRTAQLRSDIDFVVWKGNNGWSGSDAVTTKRFLLRIRDRSDYDEDAFIAAAMAAGKSVTALRQLRQVLASVRPAPTPLPTQPRPRSTGNTPGRTVRARGPWRRRVGAGDVHQGLAGQLLHHLPLPDGPGRSGGR